MPDPGLQKRPSIAEFIFSHVAYKGDVKTKTCRKRICEITLCEAATRLSNVPVVLAIHAPILAKSQPGIPCDAPQPAVVATSPTASF